MTDFSSWKVLLVEDEPDGVEVMQDILSHYGIEYHTAYDAEECLALVGGVNPTLLIIDLALPGMDGWELLRSLRGNPATAHIPAVAITNYHSANVAQEALKAGFDAYFAKPIEATSFAGELERIVSKA